MDARTAKTAGLLGSTSLLALMHALAAQAAEPQIAQIPLEIPEQVLITGSLIRGTAAVGVPVTNLGPQDFRETGALTATDLFRTIPQFNTQPGPVATTNNNEERGTRVNLRQLDSPSAPRALMMIDGVRYPAQGNGTCQLDPSIIPSVAIERVDLLLDGASATYGSDAIGGVINIILRRNFDGAVTELGYISAAGGGNQYLASQLWGRTWDGGGITLGYNWYDVAPTPGNFHSKFTFDHTPWGLDNRSPIGSSMPGTLWAGALQSADPVNYRPQDGTNCINCWAIPAGTGRDFNPINSGLGPLSPFSASTLNWATFNVAENRGTNGPRNVFNPFELVDYSAALQYNGGFLTVDQRLTRNIVFYGTGLYGMRRAQFRNVQGTFTSNWLQVAVPTFNPYYPTAGAPTNLRVAYNLNVESPIISRAWQRAMRYMGGLRVTLPGDWVADAYYALTQDNNHIRTFGQATKAQVSAALGWTLPITRGRGTDPTIATWTKPATVPYLNLFCDPRVFQCNSPATLSYIESMNQISEFMRINEKGIKADGPLFDLPGGQVKAAIGATYTSYSFLIQEMVTSANNPIVPIDSDPQARQVWATFAQLNVPIIGENNSLPGIRRLEFEGSWRHDQYSDYGGTSNPKVGFNWGVSDDLGLTIRGSWGQSFRAPNFGEWSEVSNVVINGYNLPAAVGGNPTPITLSCNPQTGRPPAGSAAELLFEAGFTCTGAPPGGLNVATGGKLSTIVGLRKYFNQDQAELEPEIAMNWAIGFDLAPVRFLPGLDLQGTWYSIKINGMLRNPGAPATARLNDPNQGAYLYTLPSRVGCPVEQNATPWLCANFMEIVDNILAHPENLVDASARTLIYWISDGGTMNRGWQKTTGIDFTASYDWDWGDLGAFNTGIISTYYISQDTVWVPGHPGPAGEVVGNLYHVTIEAGRGLTMHGVESRPRLKYRARLGWSNGPWSVTGFVDYESHYFHQQPSPPNVNNNCTTQGGTLAGGTFPCLISNYTNYQPAYYTFDLSIGYDTGDIPANELLRNIGIQLLVQNVMDNEAPYQYRITTGGGFQCACDINKGLYGRRFQLRMVKTW